MKMITVKNGTKTTYKMVEDNYVEKKDHVTGDLTGGNRKNIAYTDIDEDQWNRIFNGEEDDERPKQKLAINLTMGARTGAKNTRDEHDFYATDPQALIDFIKQYEKDGKRLSKNVIEPCAGEGHLSEVLKQNCENVQSWDLVQRKYPLDKVMDFLTYNPAELHDADIVTNPPFKYALEFIKHGLNIISDGHRVIMFMKIQFLESVKRYEELFVHKNLRYVYVCSHRQLTVQNAEFDRENKVKTMCLAWFVFERGYYGEPTLRWIP